MKVENYPEATCPKGLIKFDLILSEKIEQMSLVSETLWLENPGGSCSITPLLNVEDWITRGRRQTRYK